MTPMRFVSALILTACLHSLLLASGPLKPTRTIPIVHDTLTIDAGAKWNTALPTLTVVPDESVLLHMKARTDTANYGGCNFVLHVCINSRPLNQPREWPRLLNKPTFYHLPNLDRTFYWYRRSNHGWSTIFGPGFKEQSVVEGRDFTFLWNVSELVLPNQSNTLTITHLQPRMPEWTAGRGKLVIDDMAIQIAKAADVTTAAETMKKRNERQLHISLAANASRSDRVGERPYELVRANRKDLPPPLVTFDDVSRWQVAQYDGASATLERTREEQLWGDYCAKLTYTLPKISSAIVLRPQTPIPIPGQFDCVNLWVYGGKEYFLKFSPQVPTVYVQIEDAHGERHELSIGHVNQNYWFLQHGKFAPFRWPGEYGWPTCESWGGDGNARIEFPAKFCAIVLTDCKESEARTLFLDSLAFYREKRTRPDVLAAPAEPTYPTTPDTILPTCSSQCATSVAMRDKACILQSDSSTGTLRYIVRPETGTLSDVTAVWNNRSPIQPMAGGGILFGQAMAPQSAELASVQALPDAFRTAWRLDDATGSHAYEIVYRIKGRTLVIDLETSDGAATDFLFGTARNLKNPKLIDVPYLAFQPVRGPRVVYADGLFLLGLLDWYNTNASTFDGTAQHVSETEVAFNKGSTYLPLTNGRRNPLRERVFLTVSPEFHDVLPNIPNPPSPRLEWASKYIYNMINPPLMPGFLRLLSLHGVDHQFAICWGRIWVTRQGDSYTYRVQPRPEISYDDLAKYAEKVRSYGHVFGLGGGGRDFCPMSKRWDENLVALEPDGNWRRGWPSNYVINHLAAPRLARDAGSEIRKRYGPSVFYFDVGTQPSPWRCANDYSALIPGAGMLRSAFRWHCDLMLEFRKYHDFIVSEGGHRWMYAGLSEGDYATIPSRTPKHTLPLLVDFDLLKIHPLQHGVGMGYGPTAFYPRGPRGGMSEEGKQAWKREGISRYVAATIAYGHMGCLSNCANWGLSTTIRYFALVWPLQQEYLTDTPAEIRYHDGKAFLSPTQAVAADAYHKERVYVRYSRGLELMVNYNETEHWRVTLNGDEYLLPPFGFAACRADEILSYVATDKGQRVDYVEAPELIYANAASSLGTRRALAADGAAMMRKRDDAGWWLIPCSGLGRYKWQMDKQNPLFRDIEGVVVDKDAYCKNIRINLDRLFPRGAPQRVEVMRCDAEGQPAEEIEADQEGNILTVRPSPDVRRYLVRKK